MPRDKDFKRIIRSRMEKTGESYTAARAQLLRKSKGKAESDAPEAPAPFPPDRYSELAGMSDEAVAATTGRSWAEWVETLDAGSAWQRPHREIARHLRDEHGLSAWWAQTVTVAYERIKGLREVGQRRGGAFEAHKSKTLPVPVATLYAAFVDPGLRARWLPDAEPTFGATIEERSIRWQWDDGTAVDVAFTDKGPEKSAVAIQHRKLPSRERVEETKAYWAKRLGALAELLD